ncbi:hypothetical protein ACW7G2_10725 [Luteimonas sp. A277]
MSEIFDPLSRPVAAAARFVLWLLWEVLVQRVPWYVGWPLWRVVTLGRFPGAAIDEQDEAPGFEEVVVWVTGFLVILGLSWTLSRGLGV